MSTATVPSLNGRFSTMRTSSSGKSCTRSCAIGGRNVLHERFARARVAGAHRRARVQREAELGDRERRRDLDAWLAPDCHRVELAALGTGRTEAADGGGGELGERRLALGEAVVEQDGVPVWIESHVSRSSLHDTNGAALAFDAELVLEPAPVVTEHRVDEDPTDGAEQPAVVGEPRTQLERDGEDELPERRCPRSTRLTSRENVSPDAATSA